VVRFAMHIHLAKVPTPSLLKVYAYVCYLRVEACCVRNSKCEFYCRASTCNASRARYCFTNSVRLSSCPSVQCQSVMDVRVAFAAVATATALHCERSCARENVGYRSRHASVRRDVIKPALGRPLSASKKQLKHSRQRGWWTLEHHD